VLGQEEPGDPRQKPRKGRTRRRTGDYPGKNLLKGKGNLVLSRQETFVEGGH